MRKVRFSLDDDNNIVVEDHDGFLYRFLGYAQAMTPDPALQHIVAHELMHEMVEYTRWVSDATPETYNNFLDMEPREPFDMSKLQ